jgi:hypothetical protein
MINAVRMDKQVYEKFHDRKDVLGHVEHVYNNGFQVISEHGDLLYFQGGKWLQSPFSVVLNVDVNRWIADVSLSTGDVICIDGELIYSLNNANVNVLVHEPTVIDLRKTQTFNSFSKNNILSYAQDIVDKLLLLGRFEGLLTTLDVLKKCWPELQIDYREKPNLWSQSAAPGIKKLLQSSIDKQSRSFKNAWDTLIGLGPGLTPSGDDLLVGYLSIHYKFNSTIKRWLYGAGIIDQLVRTNDCKTTSISRQFLLCAANGLFSEILLRGINSVTISDQSHNKKLHSGIDDLLCWGHTSGTDTMVGVLMGLFTLWSVMKNDLSLCMLERQFSTTGPVMYKP